MTRPTPEGSAFTELILEIFRTHGLLLEAGDRLTRPVDLSSSRWQVLGVVDHEPLPVAHVARTMGLTRQSVQRTADVLERDGLVEYRDNPHHKRARLVAITPRGREALAFVEERQAEWADRIAGDHTREDLRAAVATLRRIRERLERDAHPGGDT